MSHSYVRPGDRDFYARYSHQLPLRWTGPSLAADTVRTTNSALPFSPLAQSGPTAAAKTSLQTGARGSRSGAVEKLASTTPLRSIRTDEFDTELLANGLSLREIELLRRRKLKKQIQAEEAQQESELMKSEFFAKSQATIQAQERIHLQEMLNRIFLDGQQYQPGVQVSSLAASCPLQPQQTVELPLLYHRAILSDFGSCRRVPDSLMKTYFGSNQTHMRGAESQFSTSPSISASSGGGDYVKENKIMKDIPGIPHGGTGTLQYSAPELLRRNIYLNLKLAQSPSKKATAASTLAQFDTDKTKDFEVPIELDWFKADVWSLGVTLYVMAFAQLPWQGSSYSDASALLQAIETEPLHFPVYPTEHGMYV